MKKAALFTLVLFLFSLLYSCKEYESMDWKLMNDRFYATLEDTVAKYDTLLYHIKYVGTDSDSIVTTYPFKKTDSGIYYQVINQDSTGTHPSVTHNDVVIVDYIGTLIDQSTFDSGTYQYYIQSSIKGWQEILHKMTTGSHYVTYIPSSMAYDSTSTNYSIPPYSVLKFDMTLKSSY